MNVPRDGDSVPSFDSTVVAKLREAGAVLLGKLNLTEGATAGYSPTFDVPRNPWNIDYWPGLSSSGSGVAVAAGLCFAATGTDTGGSIRFPSSACGVVGLKPTYGRVSRYGVLTFADSLDHVGPMARSVDDVAIIFDALTGHDPNDPTSLDVPPSNAAGEVGRDIRGMRIGIDRKYAMEGVDRGDAAALDEALEVLAGLGAQIVNVQMPDLSSLLPMWQAIAVPKWWKRTKRRTRLAQANTGPMCRSFSPRGPVSHRNVSRKPAGIEWRSRRRSTACSSPWMRWPASRVAHLPGASAERRKWARSARCMRHGAPRCRARWTSQDQWISPVHRQSVCRPAFPPTGCLTACSSPAAVSVSRRCAVSPVRTSRRRLGTTIIRRSLCNPTGGSGGDVRIPRQATGSPPFA